MARHFPFASIQTAGHGSVFPQITESQVCVSGITFQLESIVGDMISIGTPTNEILDYLLGFDLSREQLLPVFASFGQVA
jgi:hypothetical protein